MTGIPITNVNNNCSTGSTAFYQAYNLVKAGVVDCALALGFEQMSPGSLGTSFKDRDPPMRVFNTRSSELESNLSTGVNFGPNAPRMFSNGAQEYFDKYGGNIDHLAEIGAHKKLSKCPSHIIIVSFSLQKPQTLDQ
jgi:sterol carrier protein 2